MKLHQNDEDLDFEDWTSELFILHFKDNIMSSKCCNINKRHIRRLRLITSHFPYVATHRGHIKKWILIAFEGPQVESWKYPWEDLVCNIKMKIKETLWSLNQGVNHENCKCFLREFYIYQVVISTSDSINK